jgi:hypothetical protein
MLGDEMYKIDINAYANSIIPHFEDPQKKDEAVILFQNLVFKLEKNLYHYNTIKKMVDSSSKKDHFFDLMPIYFEMESLLVSFRSTIDMIMHILNFSLELKIENKDVSLFSVLNSNIPEKFKNISRAYVSKNKNSTWDFIYTLRNEIVHKQSIFQVLPVHIKTIEGNDYLFCLYKNQERDVMDLFKLGLKFIDRYAEKNLGILEIVLKNKDRF